MGCREEYLETLSSTYIKEKDLHKVLDYPNNIKSIEDKLGLNDTYGSYVTYFKGKIRYEGQKAVVMECLNELNEGLGSSLFHAIIRLSFAITAGNEEEVVRSLAYFACAYEPVTVEYTSIENKSADDEFISFVKEHDKYFCLSGTPDEKEQVLLNSLCQLYILTGSFVILHTITGFEALVNLKDYFEDYNKAIDNYTVSVLRWLKRVTIKDFKDILIDREMDFDEMKNLICDITDVHSIKLLYSSEVLYERFGMDKLKKVAHIKLKLDHGLNGL
jgi:hypothetical protein